MGDAEALVAAAFSDVLGVERVGRHDGFFDLGGHSLMAVRLAARLEADTAKTLPIRTLFEAPTIAELAAALDRGAEPYRPLLAVDRDRRGRAGLPPAHCRIICFHPGLGHVAPFAQQAVIERLAPFGPVLAVQSRGHEAGETPFASYHEMIACYAEAIAGLDDTLRWSSSDGPWAVCRPRRRVPACRAGPRRRRHRHPRRAPAAGRSASHEPDDVEPAPALNLDDQLLEVGDAFLPDAAAALRAAGSQTERLRIFADAAVAAGHLSAEALSSDPGLVERFLTVWHHNTTNSKTRPPPGTYPGPALVLRGEENTKTIADPALGWGRYCGTVDAFDVPFAHIQLLFGEAIDPVIGAVARWIAERIVSPQTSPSKVDQNQNAAE
jgi:thioesterase domain-containing protein/acyl carrier protein